MKYFKTEAGEVYAFPQTQLDTVANIGNKDYEFPIPQAFYDIRDKLKDMTELTGGELEEHLNPTPTVDQLATQGRAKRDTDLTLLDTLVSNPLRYGELSVDQKEEAKVYRQALLDVPQQISFPETYTMPEIPLWLS